MRLTFLQVVLALLSKLMLALAVVLALVVVLLLLRPALLWLQLLMAVEMRGAVGGALRAVRLPPSICVV
jgi:hypothetical protein